MRQYLFSPLLFAIGLAVGLPAPAGPATADLNLETCELDAGKTLPVIEAECGRLSVAENPAAPDGRRIDLQVAVLRARSAEPASDPVFFIAGGPGQSAVHGYAAMQTAFRKVRNTRDIVLLDQRGTGRSNALACPVPEQDWLLPELDPQAQLDWLKRCLEELPSDPRFYTTSVAVQDLNAVRRALGYERINLYGISYGSRVAQQYLREHETAVRSVVLDGVVPADLPLGPGMAAAAQRAVDIMLARCAGDAGCAEAFPELERQFTALKKRLRENTLRLDLRDPVTGTPQQMRFVYPHFVQAVRLLSYGTETVALLPLLIHQAQAENDLAPLAAQAIMTGRKVQGQIAIGMHNAVICTEDVPFFAVTPAELAQMRETYFGTLQYEQLREICAVWPEGVRSEQIKTPVVSAKPVLLLSGDADPVTPPAYAERTARTLSNSLHLDRKSVV